MKLSSTILVFCLSSISLSMSQPLGYPPPPVPPYQLPPPPPQAGPMLPPSPYDLAGSSPYQIPPPQPQQQPIMPPPPPPGAPGIPPPMPPPPGVPGMQPPSPYGMSPMMGSPMGPMGPMGPMMPPQQDPYSFDMYGRQVQTVHAQGLGYAGDPNATPQPPKNKDQFGLPPMSGGGFPPMQGGFPSMSSGFPLGGFFGARSAK